MTSSSTGLAVTCFLFNGQLDRRSPYVTLPWQQNFWVSTNRRPANMAETNEKNLTSMTFLCMIKLRNKTVANTILPSLVNGYGCLCQERLWRQKFCYHGNVTSHFDFHFRFICSATDCTIPAESHGTHQVSLFFFQTGAMLACHNYWHWALYHIEKVYV